MILGGCPELNAIEWRCVIIDEAHRLKNKNCKLLEGFKLMNLVHIHIFFYLNAKLRTLCVVPVILHSIRSNKVFLYTMKNCKLSCLLSGTQGPADRYSSPEYSGGALQLAPLPGAGTLSLRKHLHAGVWRPQD